MTKNTNDQAATRPAGFVWQWLFLSAFFVLGIAFALANAPPAWQRPGPTAIWLAIVSGVIVGGIAVVQRVTHRKVVGCWSFVIVSAAIAGMTGIRYWLYVQSLQELYLSTPKPAEPENLFASTPPLGPEADLMKGLREERQRVYELKKPFPVFLTVRLEGLGIQEKPWPMVFWGAEILLGGLVGGFAAAYWHRLRSDDASTSN